MAQPRTSKSTIKNDPFESVIPADPPPVGRRPATPPKARPVADDDAAGSSPPPAAPEAKAADAAVAPEAGRN